MEISLLLYRQLFSADINCRGCELWCFIQFGFYAPLSQELAANLFAKRAQFMHNAVHCG